MKAQRINCCVSLLTVLILSATSLVAVAQKKTNPSLFARENLVAWCIVPYDAMNRTPEQRATMLTDLGITQLAWDWREQHLPVLKEEIEMLKKNNIRLRAVWFWVNGGNGETLDETNRYILKTLQENQVKTELWLSFNNNFFNDLDNEGKLKRAIAAVGEISARARAIGCTVQLYNHGSWFGEPENQVKIIEALPGENIGIVYNFHHARHQVNDFPRLLKIMKPYLTTVNINGMKEGAPMILPVGKGDHEQWMLQELKKSGYKGSIGVLCHVEDEDAKIVLQRNLEGLKTLLHRMGERKALASY